MEKWLKDIDEPYKLDLTQNTTNKNIDYNGFCVQPGMWYGKCENTEQLIATSGWETSENPYDSCDESSICLCIYVKGEDGNWDYGWLNEEAYGDFTCHTDKLDFDSWMDKNGYDKEKEARFYSKYADYMEDMPKFYKDTLSDKDYNIARYWDDYKKDLDNWVAHDVRGKFFVTEQQNIVLFSENDKYNYLLTKDGWEAFGKEEDILEPCVEDNRLVDIKAYTKNNSELNHEGKFEISPEDEWAIYTDTIKEIVPEKEINLKDISDLHDDGDDLRS